MSLLSAGPGFFLNVDSSTDLICSPLQVVEFSGNARANCRILGKSKDLNLMLRNGVVSGSLSIATAPCISEGATIILALGNVRLEFSSTDQVSLKKYDAVIYEDAGPEFKITEGSVAIAKIQRLIPSRL